MRDPLTTRSGETRATSAGTAPADTAVKLHGVSLGVMIGSVRALTAGSIS